MPRKPRELIPGPGEYNLENDQEPITKNGGYIPKGPQLDPSKEKKGIPGPSYYNATIEPKKISFLFNAAEKWTN